MSNNPETRPTVPAPSPTVTLERQVALRLANVLGVIASDLRDGKLTAVSALARIQDCLHIHGIVSGGAR